MSQSSVTGARILVIEDEALVVMMLEEMLTEMGYTVAGIASQLAQAAEMIAAQPCDCVLLDINLGGQPAYKLAGMLAQRGTPFVFVTGYDRPDLPEEFRSRPVLRKPFDFASLRQAVDDAMSTTPSAGAGAPS